jgi:MHS family proline/betaine transporter-like MFS transporter
VFTWIVFWVGFAARPIGGIVLGIIGDRIGRRALLSISIAMMGAATLTIGILPSYASAGIAAPILLALMRIIQGFSLGGEFTGSMVYTTELASPLLRGIISSSTAAGTTLGFIIGSMTAWGVNRALGHHAAADWGWRIPILASLVFVILGYLLRRGIEETEQGVKAAEQRVPVFELLRRDGIPILQTFGIVAMTNAAYYLTFTFAVEVRKVESTTYQLMNSVSLGVVLCAKIFGGWLSDRLGRRKLMIVLTIAMIALMIPAQQLMLHSAPGGFLAGQVLIGIPIAMAFGLQGAMLVEIFPLRGRVTSMSFAYNIALALAGGLMPLIATALIREVNTPLAPAFYIMGYGVIGLAILFKMRETNDRSLDA